MPAKKRPEPLYQRGPYKLYRRPDRPALEIVWYDEERKRERSQSAASADYGEACLALDRLYLADKAHRFCPTCKRLAEIFDDKPKVKARRRKQATLSRIQERG